MKTIGDELSLLKYVCDNINKLMILLGLILMLINVNVANAGKKWRINNIRCCNSESGLSCSEYAKLAIKHFGVSGIRPSLEYIKRCHN